MSKTIELRKSVPVVAEVDVLVAGAGIAGCVAAVTAAQSGAKTMGDRVIDRTRQILATHQPSSIKPETEQAIQEVIEAAEDRVKDKSD